MKQLTCEMCGSTEVIKQEGIFVCQICGTKYSVEEAKKMMIEGTVEVTGTVKVDNSDRINNMVVNAKRAFTDGKYRQAQELFSQVLIEEPNNAQAILYEGLAIGWQGNAMKYTMDKAGDATKRALEIMYNTKLNEYEIFMLGAINEISSLGFALANLCYKNRVKTMERFNQQLKDLQIRLNSLSFGADPSYLQRESERNKKFAEEQENKFAKIQDNTLLIVLSVYEKVTNQIQDKKDISLDAYESLIGFAQTIEEMAVHTITKNKANKLITTLRKYKTEKDKILQAEKKRRIDDYWERHKDEKNTLIMEQETITAEINPIELEISEYDKRIEELDKQRVKKIDAEKICDEHLGTIAELEKKKERLGLFKGKEKKMLQEQIEQEKEKLSFLQEQASLEKENYQQEISQQINTLNTHKNELVKKINLLKRKYSTIEEELTKDREE